MLDTRRREDRRAPHGARGLKYDRRRGDGGGNSSRPARGAWIEMVPDVEPEPSVSSRPARGAWIEIGINGYATENTLSRAPHGARGLKFAQAGQSEH